MKRKLIVSIDVERDIRMYLSQSFYGIERGLPTVIEVAVDAGFVPDLFVEPSAARRYPTLLQKVARSGCYVAAHGEHTDPVYANELSTIQLERHVQDGRRALAEVIGSPPVAYREANFAVNSRTFAILSQSGYRVDASVLPNRYVKRHLIRSLVDHRGAVCDPYRPSNADYRVPGEGPLLEIPVTENPLSVGTPIGTGYLNWKGIDLSVKALREAKGNPVVFLVHPWECVDLGSLSKGLPIWVTRISRENRTNLTRLLERTASLFVPATLSEIAAEFGVALS